MIAASPRVGFPPAISGGVSSRPPSSESAIAAQPTAQILPLPARRGRPGNQRSSAAQLFHQHLGILEVLKPHAARVALPRIVLPKTCLSATSAPQVPPPA